MRYFGPKGFWPSFDDCSDNAAGGCLTVVVFIVLLVGMMIVTSCGSIKYVPVETVKKEYVSRTDTVIKTDSVYVRDSVNTSTVGDTVFVDRWHWAYKNIDVQKILRDTVIIRDSIQVPYPVEKELTKWQQMKMSAGGVGLIVCLIALIIIVVGFLINSKV